MHEHRTTPSFIDLEVVSGLVLLVAAVTAIVWANSPFAGTYVAVFSHPVGSGSGAFTPRFVVNDVVMTLFFLVVGLELRREFAAGALSSLRAASLPVAGALGGILVPAALYVGVTGAPELRAGWAIPAATDIAFAVGVLALLGRRVPRDLRILLLAIAIADDVAAIVIIAVAYSSDLRLAGLLIVAAAALLLAALVVRRVASPWAYLVPGALLWAGMLGTGLHPTLAGVVLGLSVPWTRDASSTNARMERALHPWVAFGVMPLFALANAGVAIGAVGSGDGSGSVIVAVALGLLLGKPAGILLAIALVRRLGLATLPLGIGPRELVVAATLAGIGFTMSIFIAELAFAVPALLDAAKLGVLIGSGLAAVAGLLLGLVLLPAVRAERGAGAADDPPVVQ